MDLLCNMAHMGLITPSFPFPHIFLDVRVLTDFSAKNSVTTVVLSFELC